MCRNQCCRAENSEKNGTICNVVALTQPEIINLSLMLSKPKNVVRSRTKMAATHKRCEIKIFFYCFELLLCLVKTY